MSDHALVIGGTRFIGRHAVEEFRAAGYEVTVFNRGNHENPFDDVAHVEGDRTEEGQLRLAAERVDPDVVIDCVAYHPRDVRVACDAFAHVEAYVYVSSGASYGAERIPKREDDTPLCDCTTEQATDDDAETYGPRKAEGDRAVAAAADRGVNAMTLRPPVVYGPHDYTARFDYWVDRVEHHERVLVPGDGTNLWHLAYVGDVAAAIRVVAERGEPGEAYNAGDGHAPTLGGWVELLADACETGIEPVYASARELAAVGLALDDFPLYRDPPHLLETAKLRRLGWAPTPHDETLAATVADHRRSDWTGRENGPDRETTERLLDVLETV